MAPTPNKNLPFYVTFYNSFLEPWRHLCIQQSFLNKKLCYVNVHIFFVYIENNQ